MRGERGVVLWMAAAAIVMILGMAAVTIDLASLYVARDEAQRAADAAALAGAEEFVTSGYTAGGVNAATVTTLVTNAAIAAGSANSVGGQAVQIQTSDVSVNVSSPNNPQVTVTVQNTTARGNALPTLFARIFGISSANVGATATAEAYNPSGNGSPPVATECVKPWLIPDCDPTRVHHGNSGSDCTPGNQGHHFDHLFDITTGAINFPGPASQGGVIGETLQFGPESYAGQQQGNVYYPANVSGGLGQTYAQTITSCTPLPFACGGTVPVLTNITVPTTNTAIQSLIHASGQGMSVGQDSIPSTASGPPFAIFAGPANPYIASGSQIANSDSIVSVPIFDFSQQQQSGNNYSEVTLGFMQLFITQTDSSGDINGIVLNISGCGTNNESGEPVEGTTPVPVRLVQ